MKMKYGQLLDLLSDIKDHAKTYNFKVKRDSEIEIVNDGESVGVKILASYE